MPAGMPCTVAQASVTFGPLPLGKAMIQKRPLIVPSAVRRMNVVSVTYPAPGGRSKRIAEVETGAYPAGMYVGRNQPVALDSTAGESTSPSSSGVGTAVESVRDGTTGTDGGSAGAGRIVPPSEPPRPPTNTAAPTIRLAAAAA